MGLTPMKRDELKTVLLNLPYDREGAEKSLSSFQNAANRHFSGSTST